MQVSDPKEAAPRIAEPQVPHPIAAAPPAVRERTVSPALAPYEWLPRPTTFQDAFQMCTMIANSDMAPKDYKGKPQNVLIAIQMGGEIGLKPLQAVQGIAVIGGRPSVYGDTALAVVKRHPDYVSVVETLEGVGDARVARCVATRRGEPPVEREFSVKAAMLARLWGKDGPWTNYPERMLQMRARSFAIRDAFPDALKGLSIVEDVQDVEEPRNVTPAPAPVEPTATRTNATRELLARQAEVVTAAQAAPASVAGSVETSPEAAPPGATDALQGAVAPSVEEPPAAPHPSPAVAPDVEVVRDPAKIEAAADTVTPAEETPAQTAASILGAADRMSADYIVEFAALRGLSNGGLRQFIVNVTGSPKLTKKNAVQVLDALKTLPVLGSAEEEIDEEPDESEAFE